MTPYDPLTTSTKCLAIAPVIHMTVIRMPVIHMTVISGVSLISKAERIAKKMRSARVFCWIVVWISAAIVIMRGADAVFFGPLAHSYIEAIRAPRTSYHPQIRTAPEVSPGLIRGPRQETLTSPQSSTIWKFVQDVRVQEIQNR